MTMAIGAYRRDMCTCKNGEECKSCKLWRKKHAIRGATHTKIPLVEVLKKAEDRLAIAIRLGDKQRMKNYRSQIRMILGRMKKAEEVAQLNGEVVSSVVPTL